MKKKITFTYEIQKYSGGYEVVCLDWALCTTCCQKASEAKKYAILNTRLMLKNALVSENFKNDMPKKVIEREQLTTNQFQLTFYISENKVTLLAPRLKRRS